MAQIRRVNPILLCLLLIVAALSVAAGEWRLPVEVWIGAGFFLFFVAPGLLFSTLLFPGRRPGLEERFPVSIALSMGVWAFPALLAFGYEWSLKTVIAIELVTIFFLIALNFIRHLYRINKALPDPGVETSFWDKASVLMVAIGLFALAAWTGAFRGTGLDWDYFNYISAIRKLAAWGRASIAHFAYLDAPPDPIHSYDVWALEWAIVARIFGLDPIALYSRSALFTVPAAALSFYALAHRLFSSGVARTAFFLYVCYQVIYGGLIFLGRTTFYPADSQWLIVFPACLVLYKRYEQEPRGRPWLLVGTALSVLGLSMVHVLWGLCFYLTLGSYGIVLALRRLAAAHAISAAWKNGKKIHLYAIVAGAGIPLLIAAIDCAVMVASSRQDGVAPLLGAEFLGLSPWVYALVFILAPLLYLAYLVSQYSERPQQNDDVLKAGLQRTGTVILLCLLVAVPYIILRYQAIEATNWLQFGRNPYRAFVTSSLFFLNPFQRSLTNPNMSFYPIYIAGYACLPALWLLARREYGPRLALAALLLVPLICFHPVLATLFARYFSLGYLRRLLRLAALFSFFPLALVLHKGVNRFFGYDRRPLSHVLVSFFLAALISAACIVFPAIPSYYNRMLKKTVAIARSTPKESLIYDDTPFRAMADGGWFERDAVIFSDLWTSYRLTAYLPLFVAVRQKPGTGVADQDERRLLELEFFEPKTSPARMMEILDRFQAKGVIVNRDPAYRIYNIPCGHPEAIGKMKMDPEHFKTLYDQGDWAIFRYLKGE